MSTEDRSVVGFKVTNDEFNVLQAYANEMYNFQVTDPQTNAARRMIEEPKVGLLIKEASFAYIGQFNLLKQMIANQQMQQQQQQQQTVIAYQNNQGSVNVG